MPTDKLRLPAVSDYAIPQGFNGSVWVAFTNKGRPVNVFVPDIGSAPDAMYFCHGLTLGTFHQYGYSVFSGWSVKRVLDDEYICVGGSVVNARQGDVVSWQQGGNVVHTCSIINVQAQLLSDHNAVVWTKNGIMPEVATSLQSVKNSYGQTYLIWRSR